MNLGGSLHEMEADLKAAAAKVREDKPVDWSEDLAVIFERIAFVVHIDPDLIWRVGNDDILKLARKILGKETDG